MATGKQAAANKRNATKSTGPNSAEGKQRSARNAVKHGLTMPPPPEAVLTWVKILMNDASVSGDGLDNDTKGATTWRLAEAEARLQRALQAEHAVAAKLGHYAQTHQELNTLELDVNDLEDPAVLETLLRNQKDPITKEGIKILLAANSNRLPKLVKRLEQISRYVRQAERQKAKALFSWQKAKRAA